MRSFQQFLGKEEYVILIKKYISNLHTEKRFFSVNNATLTPGKHKELTKKNTFNLSVQFEN